ncbi:uncharacterized protein BDR25DRAFT_304399 [Lindgomyces ingoldianus]|uniref:Uncharacterized protein n=1 Tax=Lindgomyces ingoldianus TaxID=673940 RepID=A0ACB6QRQ8_9PLEO|nr:uncharacterized protein BDR25DRAFT_304399 [Lindgomyces ingoldianus]KAF2469698.1 hypothetical protein BDR25DRAFT_304399 [Lindgomyces ingoldianus]
MFFSTLLLAGLVSLTVALPTSSSIESRAGGPIARPIPSTCTVTNPLPTAESSMTYQPGPSTAGALMYYAYYSSYTTSTTQMQQQCFEQCYGFGDSTQCKTAYWAQNLTVPAGYYGSPGGNLEIGCLFFNRTLTTGDFEAALAGQAVGAYAGNIQC